MSDGYLYSDPMNNISGPGGDNPTIIDPTSGPIIADDFAGNIEDNTLGQSEYDFTYTTFPEDISNDYIGHYIVININVPVQLTNASNPRTAYQTNDSRFRIAGQTLTDQSSKVDALRFGNAENFGASGTMPAYDEFLAVPRFTRRIKESIALFMPTPIVYTTTNDYQEISLSALGTGLLGQVGGFVGGIIGGERGATIGSSVGGAAEKIASRGLMLARYPINPRVEVLFAKTNLRQFRLEFLLAPRNQKESLSAERIIRTLRYHSVPEIDSLTGMIGFGGTSGVAFVPPAELDITFFNKGVENAVLPRINTCVVDAIEVDYSPQGEYATFSNGHPVAMRLGLGLREVEILHKRRILQGF
jgi:hypothetical protein